MAERVETFANATLYLGDAREVLPDLPPHGLAVFDAPYPITSGGAAKPSDKHKPMSGGWMADYGNDGKIVQCDIDWIEIFDLVAVALAPDADVYAMANDKNVYAAWDAATKAGLKFHNLLVWDKITATANRWYMKNCEFTLYLYKGRAKRIADCSSKQLVRLPQRDESGHPTEKPVALMQHYITNSASAQMRVLDPFMGSGTTGLACLRTGNPFTGIEIDETHFDSACRRFEAHLSSRQRDMFLQTAGAGL
ncbi:DNA methyltransferase [uncultured Roseibium sp.]|uniref:DNA-methyltransferase n=1 Tax=uncultured Roseibium sp. TaxID=1936171 RepID=UPI0026239737|nr:DNA methyltransferase [uncultured Roseibium sp.]